MVKLRRLALGLIALTLLAAAPSARAGGRADVTVKTFTEEIPFTIAPGPDGCEQIDTPISGVAQIEHRVRTTTFADGSQRIVDDGFAKGTATDEQGRTYRYRYENRAIVSIGPDGPLAIVDMRDDFTLRGHGRHNRIEAVFHWMWTYEPASLADPFASFVYPPQDNWIQLKTVGNPLKCDPI